MDVQGARESRDTREGNHVKWAAAENQRGDTEPQTELGAAESKGGRLTMTRVMKGPRGCASVRCE